MTTTRRTFRAHESDQAGWISSTVLSGLCTEWIGLQNSVEADQALDRWSHVPHLAGYRTFGEIVDGVDAAPGARKDQILGALVDFTQAGDRLAGRVVLQCMLPVLSRHAMRSRLTRDVSSREERLQLAITTFWEVLATMGARQRVAANLALNTLNALTAHQRRASDVWEHHTDVVLDERTADDAWVLDASCDETADDALTGAGALSADTDLAGLLRWGLQTHVIDESEARLLGDSYLSDDHRVSHELAAERAGISTRICRKRRERALLRLTDAVRIELGVNEPATTQTA